MGDVFLITATFDYDLGHQADPREMTQKTDTTWLHDDAYDDVSSKKLNRELVNKIYPLVKDADIVTTDKTRKYLSDAFNGAAWAVRDPKVQLGTASSGGFFTP